MFDYVSSFIYLNTSNVTNKPIEKNYQINQVTKQMSIHPAVRYKLMQTKN